MTPHEIYGLYQQGMLDAGDDPLPFEEWRDAFIRLGVYSEPYPTQRYIPTPDEESRMSE